MAIRIDPELERQLNQATGRSVQAVMSLARQTKGPRSPDDVEAAAQKIISRATQLSGESPSRVKVFRNMDSFVIEGSPSFLRSVIDQSDKLEAAVANLQAGSIVGKSPIGRKTRLGGDATAAVKVAAKKKLPGARKSSKPAGRLLTR